MTPPKDYVSQTERLDLDAHFPPAAEDWRNPHCPRSAWFVVGFTLGILFTLWITA